MSFSYKVEKIQSRKFLAWNEEKGDSRGNKRNKPARKTDKRNYDTSAAY